MELRGSNLAAYARYSSDRQSESSVADQLRRLQEFAAKRGRQVSPALTFTDHAISGASLARPGFDRLMEKVRRREIDALLVEDTSRLSRDNADALILYKTFAFFGVQLVAISDGIDSMTKGAKLAYSVKALMSDIFLEDLRDKTLRGMEGRAHTGLSTGGLPIGYRSVPIPGPDPRTPAGFRIEIDEDGAATVRQIFTMYLDGDSQNAIAFKLNASGVPSPRDRTRHQRKCGWAGASIRVILTNDKYRGVWRFNERRWIKAPGTNKRVPQMKDPSEVITYERPHLALVDQDTWERSQRRIEETRARFTLAPDGSLKGKALPTRRFAHALSGLLHCGCGAPMIIHGGSGAIRYYACTGGRRGRCKNKRGVREGVLKRSLMAEITKMLTAPGVGDQAEKQFAELGSFRSQEQVVRAIAELEQRMERSPASARETLRELCARKPIVLTWDDQGRCVMSAEIVQALLLVKTPKGSALDAAAWSSASVLRCVVAEGRRFRRSRPRSGS